MRTGFAAVAAGSVLVGVLVGIPAEAGAAGSTATTTAITASATTSAYDTPLTLKATVAATDATPRGVVRFTDATNGGILASVRLSDGAATFKTAALAPGARRIVASYLGSRQYAASDSEPARVTVKAGTDATGYQLNAAHDGNQPGMDLDTTTLAPLWSVTPGSGGSSTFGYPIIADNKVFVLGGSPNAIWALNAATGATAWFVTTTCTTGLAYDGHQLFCVSFGGTLTAYNADNGRTLWSIQLPGQYAFSSPPSARDGVVYVSGAGSGGTVYAVSEYDATVRWTQGVENGDDSSPAANDDGVFVAYACQQDYGFTVRGRLSWHHSTGCEGGGGDTVSLHGGNVFAIGYAIGAPLVLSQADGSTVGTFSSSTIPAFGNHNMYLVDSQSLVAASPTGGPARWVQGSNVSSVPVADGSTVFVGQGGAVYGYDRAGTQVWTAAVGSSPVRSIAIGDGILVAPNGHTVSVFG